MRGAGRSTSRRGCGRLLDYTKDGRAERAVSAYGENNTAAEYPYYGDGAVTVLRGAATGLASAGAQSLTAAALHATPAGSPFGWALGH
ncbi:hypothetical protein ACM614_29455 [Streptomyces sp. 12297]